MSANVCGTVAGALGITTSWPQVWRLWVRREHAGLSLLANVGGALYSIAWLLYGVLCRSEVQIVTSVLGIVGSMAILSGHLGRGEVATRTWLPIFVIGLAVIAAACAGGRSVVGILASLATIGGIVPQLLILAKGRYLGAFDARGISRTRWLLSAACNAFWVGYGVISGDHLITANSCLIAALGVAIAVLATPARGSRPGSGARIGNGHEPSPAAAIESLAA